MEKNYILPHLAKLLKSLVFNEFDFDFDVKLSSDEYGEKFNILVNLDPEVVCMSGDKYNPDITDFLYHLEDNIDKILPYIGLEESRVRITYKFINEVEFSNKLRGMLMDALPKIYNRVELPKFLDADIRQHGTTYEFQIKFYFETPMDTETAIITRDIIEEYLPTFEDIYLSFNLK
jgi:hypothetical protein